MLEIYSNALQVRDKLRTQNGVPSKELAYVDIILRVARRYFHVESDWERVDPLILPVKEEWEFKDLVDVKAAHAERYLSLGFHEYLKMSPVEYVSSLPEICPPEKGENGPVVPFTIEGRIPLQDQAAMAGIKYTLDNAGYNKDVHQFRKRTPYSGWFYPEKYRGVSKDLAQVLKGNEVFSTLPEGVAFAILYSHLIKNGDSVDLPGTIIQGEKNYVPFISNVGEQIDVLYSNGDDTDDSVRILTRQPAITLAVCDLDDVEWAA